MQGVGFRPFVHRLATALGVAGFVGNDAAGVFVEAEAEPATLDEFVRRLRADAPRLAVVTGVEASAEPLPPCGTAGFTIVPSHHDTSARTSLPPDVATCPACLAEVFAPADRRYRYPFANCTECGPRLTIIRDLPYDRPTTTMAGFAMCAECRREYDDPSDRRYHAQPIACPTCGPQLTYHPGADGDAVHGTDACLAAFHTAIAAGAVVAVKGVGGYHLACDATNDAAVGRLRERKGRADKPFALMLPSLAAAREVAEVSDLEADALDSAAAPIVLLRRGRGATGTAERTVSEGVAPGSPLLGVMLPYSPLHHLLFAAAPGEAAAGGMAPRALVLTSANVSDEPLCFAETEEALARLWRLADVVLTHDRPIEVPVDDSVVRVVDGMVQPVRRARGYAPMPVALPVEVAPVLAVGGELKNTFCVAAGRTAWVGPHVGDMENLATLHAFERGVANTTRMYRVQPEVVAADAHPGYRTRRWAVAQGPVHEVQHHHAHVAALMAEHGVTEMLGVVFDGTGFGRAADGTAELWGGEVLRATFAGFERVAHLRPLPLPGGDEGVRNPCRLALAALAALGLDDSGLPCTAACSAVEATVVRRQVERGVGCTPCTSMGRLFDIVASILGVRHRITYEGQAAIELEALAETALAEGAPPGPPPGPPLTLPLTLPLGADGVLDSGALLAAVTRAVRAEVPAADVALAFHRAVADAVAAVAARHGGGLPVGLTGGVFQNALLTGLARRALEGAGHRVLTHRVVPANDGGLSLGQAVIAGFARQERS